MFKMYFDSSGKSDDPQHTHVTLACCAAENDHWAEIEIRWKAIVTKPARPGYMHMKEAMSLRDGFRGWDDQKVDDLIEELLQILRFHSAGLRVLLCSANLDAYPDLQRLMGLGLPERELVLWSFYRSLELYSESDSALIGRIECFFDRNEPYLEYIDQEWKDESKHEEYPILRMVGTVEPADMKRDPPVQVADMFAWARNRALSGSGHRRPLQVAESILQSVSHKSVKLDWRQLLLRFGLSDVPTRIL